jgi:restriction endonuclease Mrr
LPDGELNLPSTRTRFSIELEQADARLLELIARDGESSQDVLWRVVSAALRTHLTTLDHTEFERLVGRALTVRGFSVDHVGGVGDQGIDLLARSEGHMIAVQCKRYGDQPITPQQMREFFGAITAAKATAATFVTTSTYTAAAREFGIAQGIELIDASNLRDWLVDLTNMNPWKVVCGNLSCRHEPKGVSPWSTHMWLCSKCGHTNTVARA